MDCFFRFIRKLFASYPRCLRAFKDVGRQVLVSTHSNDLLQDTGVGLDEVLLLMPGTEGTSVVTAGSLRDVRELLQGGLSLAEAVLPRTRPAKVAQLSLFPE